MLLVTCVWHTGNVIQWMRREVVGQGGMTTLRDIKEFDACWRKHVLARLWNRESNLYSVFTHKKKKKKKNPTILARIHDIQIFFQVDLQEIDQFFKQSNSLTKFQWTSLQWYNIPGTYNKHKSSPKKYLMIENIPTVQQKQNKTKQNKTKQTIHRVLIWW